MGSGTHHGDSRPNRARSSSRFSSIARSMPRTSVSSRSWCRFCAVIMSSARPAKGARGTASIRAITVSSMSAWTSSSRSVSVSPTTMSAEWRATVAALTGSESHSAARAASRPERMRSTIASGDRKLSCTNSPSVRPNWSLRSGMMAVWGIGMPSGWRNRAVTANQSARPPTIDASAVARTKPSHPRSPSPRRVSRNTPVAARSRPVARRLVTASCASFARRRAGAATWPWGGSPTRAAR